jgi:methanogenic corrinoid protein MtbC1
VVDVARLPPREVDRFLTSLDRRDRVAATRQAFNLLDAGHTVEEVILGLLAPAQAEVGRRWERNQWNVAQEHASTAITDTVLGALTVRIAARPTHGHVVVTCAEGEWHSLPARLFAELLGLRGWRVTFLGASTPAAHLRRFLDDDEDDTMAVAVSCSAATTIGGAHRLVEAAHNAGVPALVGGRGMGPDGRRAFAVGAEGWAPDASQAAQLLHSWVSEPPDPLPIPVFGHEHLELEARQPELVETALIELLSRYPLFAGLPEEQLAEVRLALTYTLQFLQASLLTGDATLFLDEYLPWLTGVLTSRGLPVEVVREALDVLAMTLDQPFGTSTELLGRGRQLINQQDPAG